MGRSDDETRRLMMQAAIYGRVTRRFLADAGIAAGIRPVRDPRLAPVAQECRRVVSAGPPGQHGRPRHTRPTE